MYSKVASRSTTVQRARAMEEIWTQNKRSVKYPNPRSSKQSRRLHKHFELHSKLVESSLVTTNSDHVCSHLSFFCLVTNRTES